MLLVVGTFGLVLGIIFGVYWLLVIRPEMAQEAALRARIGEKSAKVAKAVALLKTPDRLSDLPTLDRLLLPMTRVTAPLQRTIAQSGLKVTLGTIVLASALLRRARLRAGALLLTSQARRGPGRRHRRLPSLRLRAARTWPADVEVRGAVPGGDRPPVACAPGRTCADDRPVHGRGGDAGSQSRRNFRRCTTSRTSVCRSHKRSGTSASAFRPWMRGSS